MEEKKKRLGEAELEIMQVLWKAGSPVTSNYILDKLRGKRKWALSTLMTSLSRLGEKGFVDCDRSCRNNQYSALLKEEDYKVSESRSFLKKLYNNSFHNLVTTLYDGHMLEEKDLDELRRFLNQMDKEEKGC
ncbi:BlaI/MecI/CopY family transcriptional regulator [Anaerolentibacter hominis]|uniref:BlaI/MecI/CopY family transcriptional regulator n=1 Tax=Anaerolentibacter hominis TaxID=3079009 RepID=UPI0031B894AE